LSFLIAINGQFSPLNPTVERVKTQISSVGQVPTVREFKDILQTVDEEAAVRINPKVDAYQQHAKSFQQNRKYEHARDIMTSPVKTIPQFALVSEAIKKMTQYGFRHLPVVNEMNVIIGMISERELIGPLENKLCHEIMAHKVIVSDETTSINEIAITFLNEKINALPIINRKNEVTGIITLTDILAYVIKSTSFLGSA